MCDSRGTSRIARSFVTLTSLVFALPLAGAVETGTAAGQGEDWQVDVGVGYLSGDYGTNVDTDLYSFTTRLRRQFERGAVRVSLPYLNVQSEDQVTLVDGRPVRTVDVVPGLPGLPPSDTSVSGVGDAKVRGEYHVLEGRGARPWVSLNAEVKAPTADESEGLGTGEVDLSGGVGLVYPLGRTSLLLDASYTKMGDPETVDFEDVAAFGGGVSWTLGESERQQLFVYAESRESPLPGQEDRFDAALGTNARVGADGTLRFSASVLFGFSDSSEDFGVAVNLGRVF